MVSTKHLQKIGSILLPLILFLLLSSPVMATIFVEPVRLIFGLDEEERATGSIHVTNRGEEPLELIANLYDWTLNEQDEIIDYPGGTRKETLQGMIRFNPRVFTLAPKETQIVRFTITLPPFQGEAFERRGIIFFEHEAPYSGEFMGANIKTMVGTTIYAIPSTTEARFRLLAAQVHPTQENELWGALLVENEGSAHIRYQLTYRVVDKRGSLLEEGSRPQDFILPDFRREIYFPLDSLPPGEYTLHLEVDLQGTTENLTHQIAFSVKDDWR